MSQVKEYQRFELAQRMEHWVMVISFTVLAITGLPQKFAGDGWAEAMIAAMGGIEFVRIIHHAAAIVLILGSVYHGISLMYKVIVQRTRWTMYPQLQDALDALQTVMYNLGVRKEAPKYDHFSFGEKFEYWALVWGTLIMAVTGFMLWNPIITSRWVSGEVIPAAKAAHGAEAILAVLAVLTWHLYHVHIKSFNKAMFTGKLSEHEMQEEHALEFERITSGAETLRAPDPIKIRQRTRVFFPIAIVISLALLFGVFLFASAETTAVTTIRRAAATVQIYAPQTKTPTPTRQPTQQAAQTTPSTGGGAKPLPADHAGRPVCTACHTTGVGGAPKSPPDHEGRLDAQCQDCHKPAGAPSSAPQATAPAQPTGAAAQPTATAAAQPTGAAAQPTATAGAGAQPTTATGEVAAKPMPTDHPAVTTCTACHATGVGDAKKMPDDHAGRTDDQCQVCHKPQ